MIAKETTVIDGDALAESWHGVEIYKAVYGHLPQEGDVQMTHEELAKVFLELWERRPDDYSATLYFLAKKWLGEYSGPITPQRPS